MHPFGFEQTASGIPPVNTIFLFGSNVVTFTGNACVLNLVKNFTVFPSPSLPSM